jgi:hypothetical protein
MHSELDADPGFPAVSTTLTRGAAPDGEVRTFLRGVARWRRSVLAWLDAQAASGRLSEGLRDLLKRSLGIPDVPAPTLSAYDIRSFPAPQGSPSEHALDVLVWRSGIVSFLSDVWDTLGPALFEMEECQLVISAIFTPTARRGAVLCPDCLQPLPGASDEAAAHYFACPIRLRRDQAMGPISPE